MRRGLNFQAYVAFGKEIFIQTAADEIARRGETVNLSRLAALTGIHRTEIAKSAAAHSIEVGDRPISAVGSIVGMWQHRSEFRDSHGKPRPLKVSGEPSEFRNLVAEVDPTLTPQAALFQLEQLGFARRDGDLVVLLSEVSDVQKDSTKAFEILNRGLSDHLSGFLENIEAPASIKNLHLHTEFDNIFASEVPRLREWLLREGREFHRRAREFIATCDADISPDVAREQQESARARVVLSAFSLTSPVLPAANVSISEVAQRARKGRPKKLGTPPRP